MQWYATVQMKDLTLTIHLLEPLVFAELLAETVSDTVRRDLMTATVQRLHLAIVGPFVARNRKGR